MWLRHKIKDIQQIKKQFTTVDLTELKKSKTKASNKLFKKNK